jgi:hypothetical protein
VISVESIFRSFVVEVDESCVLPVVAATSITYSALAELRNPARQRQA